MSKSSPATHDWTELLTKALDGRSIADLDHAVTDRLREMKPAGEKIKPPSWKIGAYVDEGSYGEINRYGKAEIERGAEALLFRLYRQPDTSAITRILQGIDANQIGLHCSLRYPGQDPAELFRDLVKYLRQNKYDLAKVNGSVDFDPLLDWSDPPFPPLVRLLDFVSRWMPDFSVLQVNAAGFNNGPYLVDSELALALSKGAEYLKEIEGQGYPADLASRHLKFALTLGTSYHGDVAKLRALRQLWARVLAEFGVSDAPAVKIAAHTDVTTLTDNWAENEELLEIQAFSAIRGGADLIFLTPLEQVDDAPTVRARNFAIDTQLRLRKGMSPLSSEADLEVITAQLTEAAWDKYQHLVAQGGFASAIEF